MNSDALLGILNNSFTLWAILALAALGGLMSERSGVINIGLEGLMLTAAALTSIVSGATSSSMVGVIAGISAAVVLAVVHFYLTQKYHLDHVVSGMAINLFAFGATNFLDKRFAPENKIPVLPVWVFGVIALIIGVGLALTIQRTRAGLRLLAVGNDPDKAREAGLSPLRVRLWALVSCGVFCGLSGALVFSNTGTFGDGMTSGRGFIALAALIVGGWKPIQTLLACMLFAMLEAVQIQLQGQPIFGQTIPPALWNISPYLITLLALGGLIGKVKAPAGLGRA